MRKPFRRSRKPFSVQIEKTITMLIVTLGVMIVTLSFFFFDMIAGTGQKGYELKQLQIQNDSLQIQNEKLKTELTQELAFKKIENTEKFKDMTKPENKVYIDKAAKK
jgi:lipopolysaccharide export LptBFGC system permease protein LptF